MIKITFPDGNVKEFAKGTTAYQVAESISPRLAADCLAASVNGETVDMGRAINEDATIKFYKWDDAEGKHAFWHTSSHLLAEALEALYPGIKFGIGPAIDNGFYYDFDSEVSFTPEALEKIDTVIERSLRIKKAVVEEDEKEAGLRKILNLGHTIGHGIEVSSDLYHGESVALGLIPMCEEKIRPRVINVLKKCNLFNLIDFDWDKITKALVHDKKADGEFVTVTTIPEIGSFELKTTKCSELIEMAKKCFEG